MEVNIGNVLKAYQEQKWEELLVKSVLGAIEGSVGVLPTLIEQNSSNGYKREAIPLEDGVSGTIGINVGKIIGFISVTFSKHALFFLMEKVYEEKVTIIDSAILDGVGELTNLIYGLFKREVNEKGESLRMSLPNVVLGSAEVRPFQCEKHFSAVFTVNSDRIFVNMFIGEDHAN